MKAKRQRARVWPSLRVGDAQKPPRVSKTVSFRLELHRTVHFPLYLKQNLKQVGRPGP